MVGSENLGVWVLMMAGQEPQLRVPPAQTQGPLLSPEVGTSGHLDAAGHWCPRLSFTGICRGQGQVKSERLIPPDLFHW